MKPIFLPFFLILMWIPLSAQEYSGSSNLQLLYGKEQESSSVQLTTLTAEHVGTYKSFEHLGFADFSYGYPGESFDIYLEWYPKLSLTHGAGENWKWGPLTGILLGAGINTLVLDLEDFFVVLGGPVWQFEVPGLDLFQLETYVFQQLDHSTSYQLTLAWELPIPLSENLQFRFRGFIDHIGAYDGLDNQLVTQPQVLFDTGNLWGSPGRMFVGLEWRYWHNVQGMEGVTESLPQLEIMLQF